MSGAPPLVHDAALGARAERVGAERLEAFCAIAPREVVAEYGLRWRRVGGTVQMACDRVRTLNRNRTQGLGVDEAVTPEWLDDAIAFHRAGAGDFMLQVAPFARPAEHDAMLRERGLTWWRRRLLWVRDASPAAPAATTLAIREVTRADAPAYARVTLQAHGSPPAFAAWAEAAIREGVHRAWIAWDGDEAVASATLSLSASGAWLGAAATKPSHRGRGAQGALLALRIEAAREAGATLMMVETIEPDTPEEGASARNVERAGFVVTHARPSWLPTRPEEEAPREA